MMVSVTTTAAIGRHLMPCVNSTARLSLKPSQDDAEAQQLVGNQASGVLDACLAAIIGTDVGTADRELDDHTDEQRDDERAEQAESGELLEPGGEQRGPAESEHQ